MAIPRSKTNNSSGSIAIKDMSPESKRMYAILRKAGWIKNKRDMFTFPARSLGDYRFKLWLFYKLTRELSDAGLSTATELLLAVKLGEAIGVDVGWERRLIN